MRVGLVQGSAITLRQPAPARGFYAAALFRAAAYAEATYDAWAILSASHRLVRPAAVPEADPRAPAACPAPRARYRPPAGQPPSTAVDRARRRPVHHARAGGASTMFARGELRGPGRVPPRRRRRADGAVPVPARGAARLRG